MQQPGKANAAMKRLLEFARETNDPANIAIANSCHARLLLRQGKLEPAARHLQTDNLTTDSGIMFYWLECPRLTHCRILIAQETPAALRQAAEKLKAYAQANRKEHNTHRLIEILLLQTLLYRKQGQSDKALVVLKQSVTLARPGCFIRPFVETGSEIIHLLDQLRKQDVAPNYIEQILNAFSDYPPEITPLAEPLQTDFQSEDEPRPSPLLDSLTNRELDVLQLLAQRFSNKEIAAQLFISPLTVKKHTVNLYRKLGVGNRRQAVGKAAALGLISGH
jgi:LuxR family maltose regulon positive regulatory protein